MQKPDARRSAMLAALMLAVFGFMPFINPGCSGPQVIDQDTGQLRPATPAEIAAIAGKVADAVDAVPPDTPASVPAAARKIEAAGKSIVIAAGHPEWTPIVDLVVRVAALVFAWVIRPKDAVKPAAAPAESPKPRPV